MDSDSIRDTKKQDPRQTELFKALTELWNMLQADENDKRHRTLSFSDYLVDRWERARLLGFGKGTSIYDSSLVYGDVKVGDHAWIGPFTILDGTGGLEIGSYCSISAGVHIYTHDTVRWAVTAGKAKRETQPTKIGSRCYIGPNTIVAKGVTIGDGCIIGATSLVLNDIPRNSKAYGTPCKVVGKVEPSDEQSQRASWEGGSEF